MSLSEADKENVWLKRQYSLMKLRVEAIETLWQYDRLTLAAVREWAFWEHGGKDVKWDDFPDQLKPDLDTLGLDEID